MVEDKWHRDTWWKHVFGKLSESKENEKHANMKMNNGTGIDNDK